MRSGTMLAAGDALSPLARVLMRVTAVLFLLLGAVLFLAPGWASPNFLWKVSPFVAMSMGGWYLGNGYMAWEVARVWKWSHVYACMLLLWVFSLLETGVLLVFSDKLRFDAVLGWPYVVVIGVAALTMIICIVDWVRLRPSVADTAGGVSNTQRLGLIVFALAVFLIAAFPLLGFGTSGSIFPEPISQFTLRAFGCFYLSISLGTAVLIITRSVPAMLLYAKTGLALLYPLTTAALVNLDKFAFTQFPGRWIYLSIYVIVGVATTILVWRYRARPQEAEALPGAEPA